MMIRGFFTTFLIKQSRGRLGFGNTSLGFGLFIVVMFNPLVSWLANRSLDTESLRGRFSWHKSPTPLLLVFHDSSHRCLLVFVEHRLWDGLAALEAVIVFSNLAKHTGWIAHDDDVCGNVLRHHRAGTDNRVVADSHAGQDDGTCAKPYVLADVNLLVALNLALLQVGALLCKLFKTLSTLPRAPGLLYPTPRPCQPSHQLHGIRSWMNRR